MNSLFAFLKKELTEQLRTGRLWVTLALFVTFGIMNPAIAKMTPWLLELMANSLAESGMTVTEVTVSAMDSWVQFFKNMPIALIFLVLLQSSVFTKEYATRTLILSLTKGLERYKVVVSKAGVLAALWSIAYWLCFTITYLYNSYFWDNSIAKNLGLSVFCWWLFGLLTVALVVLFSTLFDSSTGVLLGTGASLLFSYVIGIIPKINRYLPTKLTDGNALIYGTAEPLDYAPAIVIVAIITIACFAAAIPIFNKKKL